MNKVKKTIFFRNNSLAHTLFSHKSSFGEFNEYTREILWVWEQFRDDTESHTMILWIYVTRKIIWMMEIQIIFRISLYLNYVDVMFLQKVSYSTEDHPQLTGKKKMGWLSFVAGFRQLEMKPAFLHITKANSGPVQIQRALQYDYSHLKLDYVR